MRISDWSSDVCSSDLRGRDGAAACARDRAGRTGGLQQRLRMDVVGIGEAGLLAGNRAHAHALLDRVRAVLHDPVLHRPALARSEEHTSELQSLMRISYAVFCLKKKKPQKPHYHKHNIITTFSYNNSLNSINTQ